jgi:hypothetical protein
VGLRRCPGGAGGLLAASAHGEFYEGGKATKISGLIKEDHSIPKLETGQPRYKTGRLLCFVQQSRALGLGALLHTSAAIFGIWQPQPSRRRQLFDIKLKVLEMIE